MADLEKYKNIRAFIADWDDVNVGTKPRFVQFLDHFAEILRAPKPGLSGLLEYWEQPIEEIVYGLFGKYRVNFSSRQLLEQYLASVPKKISPYPLPGIEEAVQKLHLMGYVQGIVSSGPKDDIIQDIRLHYPSSEGIYAFIHGQKDTLKRKPFPEVFDRAFNEVLYPLGITEEQTIYVGDLVGTDFDAAQARNLLFLAIADNDKSRAGFKKRGMDERLIFPSFTNLPDFFADLRGASLRRDQNPAD